MIFTFKNYIKNYSNDLPSTVLDTFFIRKSKAFQIKNTRSDVSGIPFSFYFYSVFFFNLITNKLIVTTTVTSSDF